MFSVVKNKEKWLYKKQETNEIEKAKTANFN